MILREQLGYDIGKRTVGTCGRQLGRVADKNDALKTLQRVQERVEHIFRQHRFLVNDDHPVAAHSQPVTQALAAGSRVIPAVLDNELSDYHKVTITTRLQARSESRLYHQYFRCA